MTALARALLPWFERHGRHDLPWQRDRDSYRIWVSEIMLQQTQVATVIPYFERFVRQFPNVGTLAAAPLDSVLAGWSGLGYYARARNLHAAARQLVAQHAGEMPATLEALMSLPGIGRSTAGAILALAHGAHHPILDGNVKRVLARYHAVAGWAGEREVERKLWRHAEAHLPRTRVADYTQAIMDLGAMLCTRTRPHCEICPLERDCAARARGLEQTLPRPRPRRARPMRRTRAVIVRDQSTGAVLLERRPTSGVWGGLFSLPELEPQQSARDWCHERFSVCVLSESSLTPIAHAFTHFDLVLEPVLASIARAPQNVMEGDGWLWCSKPDQVRVGIAAPIRTLLEQIEGAKAAETRVS